MRNSIEIEFKTKLSQKKYEELLQKLELNDKIFPQTNFYFDTINGDLERQKIVLRIRKKEKYKLTSKMTNPNDLDSTLETHLELTDSEAIDMLKNGFNASIINLNYDVINICTLTTYRAKMPFLNGVLFLDKSEYNGITDYELEFEANSHDTATYDFNTILKKFDIKYEKSISKFKRCWLTRNK